MEHLAGLGITLAESISMKVKLKDYWSMLKQSFSEFGEKAILKKSAALSYYTVFALAPMLIIIITVAQFFYGREAIEGSIYHQIDGLVGSSAAVQIQELIKNAAISGNSTIATIISIVTLVLTATGVFTEIQDSINEIWHLKAKPKAGFMRVVINRLISFSMVVSLGFILLVSLVINAVIEAFGQTITRWFPHLSIYLIYAINLVITLGIITILFAIIFKVLPDAVIRWKDVVAGAVFTAILFVIGKFGIALYLAKSDVTSSYGAAGSIILILLWVYYSAIILYFGAVFTRVYAQCKGCKIYPNKYAVFVEHYEKESKASLQSQDTTKKVVEKVHIEEDDPEKDPKPGI